MNVIAGYEVEILAHPEVGLMPQHLTTETWDEYMARRREWTRKADQVEDNEPNTWFMGIGVRVNGRMAKFLTTASRYVFVDEVNDLVVKVAIDYGQTQTWREFQVYHEVLDDEARTIVPEILGIGATQVDGRCFSFTLMRRVDFVPEGDDEHDSYVTHSMSRFREQVARVLRTKYRLSDLHGNNLSFTKDGCVCLVDLGISDGRPASATSSPIVQSVATSLPQWAREAMNIHP